MATVHGNYTRPNPKHYRFLEEYVKATNTFYKHHNALFSALDHERCIHEWYHQTQDRPLPDTLLQDVEGTFKPNKLLLLCN